MLTRLQALSAAFILVAGGASAASVQIDFTNGQNTSGSLDEAGQNASGVWSEDGFDVSWDYIDAFGAPNAPVASDFDAFRLLSDCGTLGGCAGHGTQMTITEASGGAFSLMDVSSDFTLESFVLDAEVTFFRPDGTLNYNDQQRFSGSLIRNSLSLTGVKSDGSTVTGGAATASAGPNGFGAGSANFEPGMMSGFTDLVSLTVSADGSGPTDSEQRDTLMANGIPLDLLHTIEACGFQSCIVPGLGELTYDMVYQGTRNDTIAVRISGLELESMAPAHAPLPASVLFLGAGLGLLGFGRLRRKA